MPRFSLSSQTALLPGAVRNPGLEALSMLRMMPPSFPP